MVDLTSIKPKLKTVEIKHPDTNENLGLSFDLASPLSNKMQKRGAEIRSKHIERIVSGEDVEVLESEIDEISEAAEGWNWHSELTFQGKIPEFSMDNVKKVLNEDGLSFIHLQLKKAFNGGGFFPLLGETSKKSSTQKPDTTL